MGTNTDPYQRAEGKYRLTRSIIEVLGEAANPFSILTKSSLVLRDLDVLVAAGERTDVRVNLSIGTLDSDVWRATEPGTPHPAPTARGGRRAQRGRHPVRRARRADPARAVRRPRAARGGGHRLRRGRRRVGVHDPAPPPTRREAALPRDAAGVAPRRGGVDRAPLPEGQRAEGRPAPAPPRSCTPRSGGPVGAAQSRARASTSPATSTPHRSPNRPGAHPDHGSSGSTSEPGWQCGGMDAPDTVTEATRTARVGGLHRDGHVARRRRAARLGRRHPLRPGGGGRRAHVPVRGRQRSGRRDGGVRAAVPGARRPRHPRVGLRHRRRSRGACSTSRYIASRVENP